MKKFKRLIAIATVLLFALSIIAPVFAQDEAAATTPYDDAAKVLVDKGIMKGDENGDLMLDKQLTRAEILALIIRATGQEDTVADYAYNEPSFSDVPQDHWAFAYVEAGKDLGIVNGYPDGTFKPDKPVKFEELCKMLVAAKNENPASGKWPLNYVRKALELGFFTQIEDEVGIGDLVIRGQAAVAFANAFFPPEKTIVVGNVYSTGNTTVDVYLSVYGEGSLEDGDVIPLDFEIKQVDNEAYTIAVKSVTLDVAAGKATLTTDAQKPGVKYQVYFKGNATSKTFVGSPVELALTNVATDNLKTVTLTFNDELDPTTVVKDNFAVGTLTLADAKLAADKKSVVVVLSDKMAQFTKYTVTAKNIKSVNGKSLASTSKDVVASDTKQPDVSKAEFLNAKMLKLTFTEPMNVATDDLYTLRDWVKVNGVPVSAKVTDVNYVDKTITLALYNAYAKGTYNVEVSAVQDFANFAVATKTFTAEVKDDLAAPQLVNAKLKTRSTVTLTFDEPINDKGNITVNGIGVSSTTFTSGKSEFDVTLSSPVPVGTRILVVVYDSQTDMAGNKVTSSMTRTFEIPDDTTAPDVKSVTVASNNTVTIVFTKAMSRTGTVKVYQGSALKDETPTLSWNDASDTLTITSSALASTNPGAYTLKLSGFKDATIRENLMLDKDISINAYDTVRPTVSDKYIVTQDSSSSDKDKITIYFSEPMDVASITTVASYVYVSGGNETPLSAHPNYVAGSLTAASDGKSVSFTFKNARALTTESFKVIAVKDAAGNITNPAIQTATLYSSAEALNIQKQYDGVADAVYATSTSEIVVYFTNDIVSVDPRVFKLKTGSSEFAFVSASVDSTNKKKVKFTSSITLPTDISGYTVAKNDYTKITDIYGKTLNDNSSATTTANVVDQIRPTFTVSSDATGKITITASEAVYANTYADVAAAIVLVKADDGSQVTLNFNSGNAVLLDANGAVVSGDVNGVIPSTGFKKIEISGLTSGKAYNVTIIYGKIIDLKGNQAVPVVNSSVTVK